MVLGTIQLSPKTAYGLLVELYSYTVVSIFGFTIAVGMLKLRFSSRERWREKSNANPLLSILAAFIFAIASAYPIVAFWVPPTSVWAEKNKTSIAWYTVPVVAWCILTFGALWYLGFLGYAARRARKDGVEFQIQKVPEFDRDPALSGPPVQVHETIYMAWVAEEFRNQPHEQMEERRSRESF